MIDEEINMANPQSIHYVFGGMAPITARLIERMFEQRGFQAIQRALNLLPGQHSGPSMSEEIQFFGSASSLRPKKVLVYFLGGVTFAEVAAIRFLNQRFENRYKFVVATTSIISGEKCMD